VSAAQYRTQHLTTTPRGWRVRSKRVDAHVLRFAFPPGPRRRGSGKVLEILHPKNPVCAKNACAIGKKNPSELLIFGNPRRVHSRESRVKRNAGTKNHRPDCACFACKYKRGENPKRRSRKARHSPLATRHNPESSDTSQAVKLFASFHGRDPKEIAEKHESAAMRLDYAALGDLDYIKIETPIGQVAELNFEGDGVKLASSPDGKQLYLIGGNQNLSGALEADSLQKDFIDLGEALEVQYIARKIHSNFEPTSWFHKFGEKGGARPRLMYDKLRKRIYFVGGEYFINAKSGVSPGIEG